MEFYIIGIDDNQHTFLPPDVQQIIDTNTVFSGGLRHHQNVKDRLPKAYQWIEIKIPLKDVFANYQHHQRVVVFASGDPLFFGFGNTLLREFPQADIKVYPYFNSLQMLAHRLLMPYHDMHMVSLTGRSWQKFDEALIHGYEKIGILTDNKNHTPRLIAAYMLRYGYDNYQFSVGCLLGNRERESFGTYSIDEVQTMDFDFPNNIILIRQYKRKRPMGIPDAEFSLLDGRARMITKMPIRLLSLSMMELRDKKVMWDVGFCTGSVSIEAKLQFPHLEIIAFEKRPQGEDLMKQNCLKMGTPGIESITGDFFAMDLTSYPQPDAIFIGGHGGRLAEMMDLLSASYLSDNGCIVFNAVSEETKNIFVESAARNHLHLEQCVRVQIDDYNVIEVLKVVKNKRNEK